ncbi:MAG: nucleotidyl transferase AbiEii/AbiGii toxin family protein [Candidatus Thermoplasmatota archaeon]|nr:nucleotidyl transferase AbiEii/AbiGii toxin family protein [Candidatus Thermoplasmatota archaeon]
MDITDIENEIILLPVKRKTIYHPYPDNLEAVVLAYSLEEMLAEKIRSLFQRTRPRDLFDVWYLKNDKVEVEGIIEKKFSNKGMTLDIDDLVRKKDLLEKAWNNSLRHQMRTVPDFEQVFNEVVRWLEGYPKDRVSSGPGTV